MMTDLHQAHAWPFGPLGNRVCAEADAAGAAAAVVAVWRDVERVLRPVIGARGVVALFIRSAHVAAGSYPWLAPAAQNPAAPLDLDALQALFVAQGAQQTLAAGNHLLDQLHRLLEHLIGHLLTAQLLRAAWGPHGPPTGAGRTPVNAHVKVLGPATGVPGLDTVPGGGLPRGYLMRAAGPPGSDPSMLAA